MNIKMERISDDISLKDLKEGSVFLNSWEEGDDNVYVKTDLSRSSGIETVILVIDLATGKSTWISAMQTIEAVNAEVRVY